jgi:integrase
MIINCCLPSLPVEIFWHLLTPLQRYICAYATTRDGPPQLAAVLGQKPSDWVALLRHAVLRLHGTARLMAGLLYGSGLRLMECVRLRIKDIDFGYARITVRDAKGARDRVTMLPLNVATGLRRHLQKVRAQHEQDLVEHLGEVWLPDALAKKYRNAACECGWQYVFPSSRLSIDPRSGKRQRHHIAEGVLQAAVKNAPARQA